MRKIVMKLQLPLLFGMPGKCTVLGLERVKPCCRAGHDCTMRGAESEIKQWNCFYFGNRPGTNDVGIPGKNVGYMPQDISSTENFPFQKHSATLELSVESSLISNPKLLILDEPTVGVDALLRQKIWTYLKKLASCEGTTIIISTHYLDEARQADMIGIIRDGKMIAETSPTQLINSQGTGSLQSAVLNLCRKSSNDYSQNDASEKCALNELEMRTIRTTNSLQKSSVPASKIKCFNESVTRIRTLVEKNFAIVFRNLLLLTFVIWIPAIEVLSVCVSFGYSPAHLKLGVINQEMNASSCPSFSPIKGECDLTFSSCTFLHHISKKTIDLVSFDLEQDAEAAVHSGSIWGYLVFQPEFSSSIYDRALFGVNVDDIALNSSQVIVKLDETNKQISTTIKIELHDAFSDFTSALLADCGYDSRQSLSPLQYGSPIFGKDDTELIEYTSTSMALAAVFFWPILTVGTRFMEERKCGMMERSIVAGVRTWEIMGSYLISEFFILMPQTLVTLAVVLFVCGIKIVGSIYLALGLLLLIGCCGASLGFLFGSFCREKIEVPILGLAFFIPNLILCGIYWPIEGMSELFQCVAKLLPCTLAAESIRSIVSRGWAYRMRTFGRVSLLCLLTYLCILLFPFCFVNLSSQNKNDRSLSEPMKLPRAYNRNIKCGIITRGKTPALLYNRAVNQTGTFMNLK
ncbi:ABC transporter G family member 20 [Orchesella cincta]|uniref:ABC transporter G family member 20 n=1 Tax=Orchesella cincta TaxID=48709 RepID=A0A1D2MID8_ORCCI|nr:ABC transporter G family member 20 [Orchesella cincta]